MRFLLALIFTAALGVIGYTEDTPRYQGGGTATEINKFFNSRPKNTAQWTSQDAKNFPQCVKFQDGSFSDYVLVVDVRNRRSVRTFDSVWSLNKSFEGTNDHPDIWVIGQCH